MKITIFLIALMTLSVFPMVSARPLMQTSETLELYEKNPSDWSIVEGGAYGEVVFTKLTIFGRLIKQRARVTVHNLEPKTEYQLIEYIDPWSTHEAICIGKPRKTSTKGYFKSGSTNIPDIDNSIDQKFWVVLASDVDCEESKMINWQPSEYLFENNLV